MGGREEVKRKEDGKEDRWEGRRKWKVVDERKEGDEKKERKKEGRKITKVRGRKGGRKEGK